MNNQINWKTIDRKIEKLQIKILMAYKQGKLDKVLGLQRILVLSYPARLKAVHKTLHSTGSNTPGIDNELWNINEIAEYAKKLGNVFKDYKASPVKILMVPKKDGTKKPLSIPTIKDRAVQNLFVLALSPISEYCSDINSFGYRPNISAQDAIQTIYVAVKSYYGPKIIVNADIRKFFDMISHKWIMNNIPMDTKILSQFVLSGILSQNKEQMGVPQGGVISPYIANMALNGLEKAVYDSVNNSKYKQFLRYIHVVRYADDFVITSNTHECADHIIENMKPFLTERGLQLHSDKIRVIDITYNKDKLEFLGYELLAVPYRAGGSKYNDSHIVVFRPSAKSIENFQHKVDNITSNYSATNLNTVYKLNMLINGWANYHKIGNSSDIFRDMDKYIRERIFHWAEHKHPGIPLKRIYDLYFIKTNNYSQFHGVYKDSKGRERVLLLKLLAAIKIVYLKEYHPYSSIFTQVKK